MHAKLPDQLTGSVWQMLADARTSAMTRAEATEQTILFLRRNLSYLARRERRGHHTSYDELLERDLEAISRLVVLLEPSAAAQTAAESEGDHESFRLSSAGASLQAGSGGPSLQERVQGKRDGALG